MTEKDIIELKDKNGNVIGYAKKSFIEKLRKTKIQKVSLSAKGKQTLKDLRKSKGWRNIDEVMREQRKTRKARI